MATGKITKRAVDAMRAGSRNDFLWDTETKGFGVKITPAGKRVYILQYRLGGAGTKTQRYTIGAHGTWTPDASEREAKRLLALVDQNGRAHVCTPVTNTTLVCRLLIEKKHT